MWSPGLKKSFCNYCKVEFCYIGENTPMAWMAVRAMAMWYLLGTSSLAQQCTRRRADNVSRSLRPGSRLRTSAAVSPELRGQRSVNIGDVTQPTWRKGESVVLRSDIPGHRLFVGRNVQLPCPLHTQTEIPLPGALRLHSSHMSHLHPVISAATDRIADLSLCIDWSCTQHMPQ